MGQYSSYYLYQKYEKRGEQDWIPCYPNTFSMSGDSENPMPFVVKVENDPACGYVDVMYRWVNLDPTVVWVCEGTTKYYKQQKEVSYDNGTTWIPVEEYQKGALIETSSTDCGEPIYDWNLVNGYICDDCGYNKLAVGVSANTYTSECTTAATLTSGDVVSLTAKSAIEWAVIGYCVTAITENAFSDCYAMEFCRIPNKVRTIGDGAFENCSAMTECSLPSGIQSIGNSAFTNSISLAFINLPNGVTSLGSSAFEGCLNFRYINIPDSLTYIPSYCFYNCDGISDIELHSGITTIGDYAFGNCSGIYTMTLHSTTPPTLGTSALSGTSSNLKIYVPSSAVNTYKTASGWSSYSNKIFAIE